MAAPDSALRPSSSKARTRTSASPYSSRAAWVTARVAASAASRVPVTSATPSATPTPGRAVRVAGGRVGGQECGPGGEGAGQGPPLLLPGRQLVGRVIGLPGEADH